MTTWKTIKICWRKFQQNQLLYHYNSKLDDLLIKLSRLVLSDKIELRIMIYSFFSSYSSYKLNLSLIYLVHVTNDELFFMQMCYYKLIVWGNIIL